MMESRSKCSAEKQIACPQLMDKTVELLSDHPADLSIRSRRVANVTLSEIATPPVIVTQDCLSGEDSEAQHYHLVLVFEGEGTYHWANGSQPQKPGDIVLLDTTMPSQVISHTPARLVRWCLPQSLVHPFLPLSKSNPLLHLPAGDGLMGILTRHMCELAREADNLDDCIQQGLLTHLCGLLGLAIEARDRPEPKRHYNYRSFQRQRVLTYIETHLRDPDLTVRQAAAELGMSSRWLHALLEDMGESFADLVARRRLENSLALLGDPGSERLSIAEIAFLCGFNDLSTFYRRFGRQYGVSPGEARRTRTRTPLAAQQPNPMKAGGLPHRVEGFA
ncbi:MAG: helix-turn-helix domain-containing protein [Pseudomonadota bacterium]|uniref:helix-turn-helix domain-containing protein n=1 Tax=Fodinicurvata fenggangensis TaxID=1121830 RepID=UPI00047B7A73|nr:helix-turn-helix domain-containing protein [Fodinicurvata fenggangensis]